MLSTWKLRFLDRLATFASCQNGHCGWNWESAGFMYATCDDAVFCGDRHVEIPFTTEQDPCDVIHQRSCPRTSADESVEDKSSEDARLRTFGDWPSWANVSPAELAKYGFYYSGLFDRVKCIYCHGVLRNWVETDHV